MAFPDLRWEPPRSADHDSITGRADYGALIVTAEAVGDDTIVDVDNHRIMIGVDPAHLRESNFALA